jgi:hypothetical protein
VQKPPVRYSDAAAYTSATEFAALCIDRLLLELGEITALEMFSTVYSTIDPWEAIAHSELLDLVDRKCVPHRHRNKWQTFRARE